MEDKKAKLSPKALEWLALAAVVLFGLIVAYAIHMTNKAIADIDHYYGQADKQLVDPAAE